MGCQDSLAVLAEVERQTERLKPRIATGAFGPLDQKDCISGGIQAQFVDLGLIFDAVEIDVPDRRLKSLIGLDDRKARTRNLAPMAERFDKAAGQGGFAYPE